MAKLDWWRLQLMAMTDWLDDSAGDLWDLLGAFFALLGAFFALLGLLFNLSGQLATVVTEMFGNVVQVWHADPAAAEMAIWSDTCFFWAIDLVDWLIENSILSWYYYLFMLFMVIESAIYVINKLRARG